MPGQRRSRGSRARGSWLPRLAGLGVVVLLAAAAVAAYLVGFHPAATHHAPPLSTKVVSDQTVGLVVADTQLGGAGEQLLQLLGPHGTPEFSPVAATQQTEASPQWT